MSKTVTTEITADSSTEDALEFAKANVFRNWGFPDGSTMLADGDDDDDSEDNDEDEDEDEIVEPKPKAKVTPKPKAKPKVVVEDEDEDEDDEPLVVQKSYTPGYVKNIKAQTVTARAERESIRTEFAVYKAAVGAGANVEKLMDSRKFLAEISKIDTNDSEAVAKLITDTVEANPGLYKAASSTPTRNPRPGTKVTQEDTEERSPRSRLSGAYSKTSDRK